MVLDREKLHAFVDDVHRYLVSRDTQEADYQILARLAKLTEEVGELSEHILRKLGHQRAAKYHGDDREERNDRDDDALGAEIADVIICAILIAKTADVDREVALHAKIETIRQRLEL